MLKQKFSLDFLSKLFHYILQTLGGIIVARFAGPSVIGLIAYGTAFAGVFGFVNGLFGPAHIKIVAEQKSEDNCNKTFFILKVITTFIFVFFVLTYYVIKDYFIGSGFDSNEYRIIIFLSVAIIVIQNFTSASDRIFIARMEQAKSNIPSIFQSIFYNIGRSVLAILGFGAVILISSQLVTLLFLIIFYLYFLRNIPFGKYSHTLAKRYFTLSIPIFIVVLSNSLSVYLGRLLLEGFTDIKSLGLYTAGYNIAGIFLLMASTAGTVFFPLFSKAVENDRINEIIKYIKHYERFLFLWIFPLTLFLSLFGKYIIILFLSMRYIDSASVFQLLVIASFLQLLIIPFSNLLLGFNKFNLIAYLGISRLTLQIGLLFVFSYPKLLDLGIAGFALAQLISDFILFIIRYKMTKGLIGINIFKESTKYLLVGIFFYILYFIFQLEFKLSGIFLIFLMISYFICFYSIIFLFKLIDINDFKILISLLNPRKMKDYIKFEIFENNKKND